MTERLENYIKTLAKVKELCENQSPKPTPFGFYIVIGLFMITVLVLTIVLVKKMCDKTTDKNTDEKDYKNIAYYQAILKNNNKERDVRLKMMQNDMNVLKNKLSSVSQVTHL
jgi:uncharacterized membrane protein